MIVHLIVGLIKKTQHDSIVQKTSQYFAKPHEPFGGDINVEVDLATKTDLKNVTHVDTSSFALKTSLAHLKIEVDKLDIDKLAPVPVKNDIDKKNCI